MFKLYISVLGVYVLATAWMALQNTGSIEGSEIVKACKLFGEKRCSGSNSKICYSQQWLNVHKYC